MPSSCMECHLKYTKITLCRHEPIHTHTYLGMIQLPLKCTSELYSACKNNETCSLAMRAWRQTHLSTVTIITQVCQNATILRTQHVQATTKIVPCCLSQHAHGRRRVRRGSHACKHNRRLAAAKLNNRVEPHKYLCSLC